jgi:outer membrane protein assembly factor BamB
MTNSRFSYVLTAISLCGLAAVFTAEPWPQWRGPLLNGISVEKNLPVRWSKTENIAWRISLPPLTGSTPVIWGQRVFLHLIENDAMYLWCVDRNTGAALWKKHLSDGDMMARKENMSSPSPVTDGTHVWVMTGTGVVKAFDMDGNERWSRNLPAEYGAFGLNWNYASSPLLYKDALIVQVVHGMKTEAPSYVLNIDKLTGKTRWRVERADRATGEGKDAYTTPSVVRLGNADQIVVSGAVAVTGHDPETGKELWRANGLNDDRTVASPVVFGDMIFAPSRQRPLLALKTGGHGDVTNTHVLWSFAKGPDVPTPVTDGTYLYSITDNGVLYCLDARTGAVVYQQRLRSATYSGSPVLADGRMYVTNEDGVTTVAKVSPPFELIAENDLDDYTLSSPAISDGQIFIRTKNFLYAIGAK